MEILHECYLDIQEAFSGQNLSDKSIRIGDERNMEVYIMLAKTFFAEQCQNNMHVLKEAQASELMTVILNACIQARNLALRSVV